MLYVPDGPDVDLLKKSRKAYDDAGLERSHDKSFGILNPPDGDPHFLRSFTAWGTEVLADAGTAAAPAEKRVILSKVGAHILAHKSIPKYILRRYLALL
eukprot:10136243-Karenia_brevis.AAC.1